jgi:hypothetical protein
MQEPKEWDWVDVLIVGLVCVGFGTSVVAIGYAAFWLGGQLGVW